MNKSTITKKIMKSCFQSLLLFYIVVIFLAIVAIFIGNSRIWYGDEPFFYLLRMISNNGVFIMMILLIGGTLVIVGNYWIKTIKYLDLVVEKSKSIYDLTESPIELPEALLDVEKQLNAIKYNLRENQHLAKEAEQRKNDLVVYLAHDLKTPLTSIIGYLTLLQDEVEISPNIRERYLKITLEKAQRLEDLINEFFEITRFNLSQLSLELGTVNLTRMLEQVIFEFEPLFRERGLDCTLKIDPDILIKCDVNKMYRVFDNLLRNAINYSYEGSQIQVFVTEEDQAVKVKVMNQGPTISPEKIERLFEQFYRLDTSRGTQSGGSGLGLAITKKIIELHQGTISAHSEDELIVFEFNLPSL